MVYKLYKLNMVFEEFLTCLTDFLGNNFKSLDWTGPIPLLKSSQDIIDILIKKRHNFPLWEVLLIYSINFSLRVCLLEVSIILICYTVTIFNKHSFVCGYLDGWIYCISSTSLLLSDSAGLRLNTQQYHGNT